MDNYDTIAAVCTGYGGAVSIIRVSGKNAVRIVQKCWKGSSYLNKKNARRMLFGQTRVSSSTGEPALAVYMPGPNSYTGEDVVEIHCHGGTFGTKELLNAVIEAGARNAEAGEFTYRAFINGKIDLTQAEAVGDMISAHSKMALHTAERQISGYLKDRISVIRSSLSQILSDCESRLDFSDEDISWDSPEILLEKIEESAEKIADLLESRSVGAVLRNGISVVIAGKPNVGKSSFLNMLLGFERAIVTQFPGTTRDTLEEMAHIGEIPVRLTDTAGIREADDLIENMGVERSRKSMATAQFVIWLLDAGSENPEQEIAEMKTHLKDKKNYIAVWNKIDILKKSKWERLPSSSEETVKISIEKRINIDNFLNVFQEKVWGMADMHEPEIAVNSRHAELLELAVSEIPDAEAKILNEEYETASVHLRKSVSALGKIIGEEFEPDILDNIFKNFCIGK